MPLHWTRLVESPLCLCARRRSQNLPVKRQKCRAPMPCNCIITAHAAEGVQGWGAVVRT